VSLGLANKSPRVTSKPECHVEYFDNPIGSDLKRESGIQIRHLKLGVFGQIMNSSRIYNVIN
jgi:hypothetical protein